MQAPALAQGAVYRCPGPPVLYTDSLSANEARDRGCRTVEGAPVTVMRTPPAAAGRAPAVAASGVMPATAQATARINANEQRARDAEARRILQDELRRGEEQLAALLQEYNNGEPERQGNERNYQRYLDRVEQLKLQIARKEADLAAIRREIGKLPANAP
ncbi:hypothetical protein [Aquabacterium sp. J223]|uniref:hypothetical protein n=1 Tax=Aquabacterium sp. J223 TaxID=2898431 RepID=UPI0021AD91CB|nr:hypothetical protein [Aquabacterium sp. J223]UUX97537.1 hypothetical protein LRS07_10040 [Aquabacterium sp. J223]